MRDRRFVAVHRGGPLSPAEHRLLALWAAACAESVLPLYEAAASDGRPRNAIALARAWARGGLTFGAAREASLAAHAAAREASAAGLGPAAVAAARAAGQAVATAHAADHSLGAALYALKAARAAGRAVEAERAFQDASLPEPVRILVLSARLAREGAAPSDDRAYGAPPAEPASKGPPQGPSVDAPPRPDP